MIKAVFPFEAEAAKVQRLTFAIQDSERWLVFKPRLLESKSPPLLAGLNTCRRLSATAQSLGAHGAYGRASWLPFPHLTVSSMAWHWGIGHP